MPPTPSRQVRALPKRRGLACERCRARKQKCLPGEDSRCRSCCQADVDCEFLEKTPRELFLQQHTAKLEARVHQLQEFIAACSLQVPDEENPASTIDHQLRSAHQIALVGKDPEAGTRDGTDIGSEGLAAGVGFLSLHDSAAPLYLGGSSGFGWAQILTQSLQRSSIASKPRVPHLRTTATGRGPSGNFPSPLELPDPPPERLGLHYISTVYTRVQSRYGFLDWAAIQSWQARARELCSLQPLDRVDNRHASRQEDVDNSFGAFFLWMLYSLGAKLCESETGSLSGVHETYYDAALGHFVHLAAVQSMSTVQALLLLVVYSFRNTSSAISLWHACGIAIRSAIELGLHRRIRSSDARNRDPRAYCMRQRVFWGAYILDRMISIQFGRPFAIQDRDIDIELPMNIDSDVADEILLRNMLSAQARLLQTSRPGAEYHNGYGGFSSMTSFIHTIRLNQIKTKIHELVYTVERPSTVSPDNGAVMQILNELEAWRSIYPHKPDSRLPACSHEFFEVEYHNCVQILLRPLAARSESPTFFLTTCGGSAAAVLDVECQLLRRDSKNLAIWVLCKIFMSGLTLLHVIWNHPGVLSASVVSRALRSCSTCLFIYAQQFSAAGPYLDCFEDLVKAYEERQDTAAPPTGGTVVAEPRASTSQWDQWLESLDVTENQAPGMREEVTNFMIACGLMPDSNPLPPPMTQPGTTMNFSAFPAPGGLPFGNNSNNLATVASSMNFGETLWDLPFDAWAGNGTQGIDFSGLFESPSATVQTGTGGMEQLDEVQRHASAPNGGFM